MIIFHILLYKVCLGFLEDAIYSLTSSSHQLVVRIIIVNPITKILQSIVIK